MTRRDSDHIDKAQQIRQAEQDVRRHEIGKAKAEDRLRELSDTE